MNSTTGELDRKLFEFPLYEFDSRTSIVNGAPRGADMTYSAAVPHRTDVSGDLLVPSRDRDMTNSRLVSGTRPEIVT